MSNDAKVDNRAGIPLNKPFIGNIAILTARRFANAIVQIA